MENKKVNVNYFDFLHDIMEVTEAIACIVEHFMVNGFKNECCEIFSSSEMSFYIDF